MNLAAFLEHWSLAENPFKGEEARQDGVLSRLASIPPPTSADRPFGPAGLPRPWTRVQHPDFEKIAGDLRHPSAAIVFGEKGSGKTAIRLQLAEMAAAHNAAFPNARVLLVPYDQLNEPLDRFWARLHAARRDKNLSAAETFKQLRLVDHIDAILGQVVPRLVDAALDAMQPPGEPAAIINLGADARRELRALDPALKHDLLLLQVVYDREENAPDRTRALRRRLGLRRPWLLAVERVVAAAGWLLPLAVALGYWAMVAAREPALGSMPPPTTTARAGAPAATASGEGENAGAGAGSPVRPGENAGPADEAPASPAPASSSALSPPAPAIAPPAPPADAPWVVLFSLALLLWLVALGRRLVVERLIIARVAHRLRRQLRVLGRGEESYARALRRLARAPHGAALPMADSDAPRYAMLERLRRVLRPFGYASMLVIVDRVDEPTLISGDAERMKAVAWPMLSNKFLQHEGLGVKLLLPIELRHMLFRESSAFFQDARLDKQCLVEQLGWTGAMLYDLCTARLNACRPAGAAPVALRDLFAEDVTRQDLVDALDQMRQPRDAFKFLYQCLSEHCAARTVDAGEFRVPRPVLEIVRRQQAERVRQLGLGVRPA